MNIPKGFKPEKKDLEDTTQKMLKYDEELEKYKDKIGEICKTLKFKTPYFTFEGEKLKKYIAHSPKNLREVIDLEERIKHYEKEVEEQDLSIYLQDFRDPLYHKLHLGSLVRSTSKFATITALRWYCLTTSFLTLSSLKLLSDVFYKDKKERLEQYLDTAYKSKTPKKIHTATLIGSALLNASLFGLIGTKLFNSFDLGGMVGGMVGGLSMTGILTGSFCNEFYYDVKKGFENEIYLFKKWKRLKKNEAKITGLAAEKDTIHSELGELLGKVTQHCKEPETKSHGIGIGW